MSAFIQFRRAFIRAVRWHGERWKCFPKKTKLAIIQYWY